MDKKLYELMNWPRIEALVYSEEDEPQEILGPHKVKGGTLIQAFLPTAVRMEVILKDTGKAVEMEKADDGGFFAALVPGRKIPSYHFRVTYDNDMVQELEDIYRFTPQVFTKADLEAFGKGIHYTIYEKMGAHPMTIDGVEGTYFAVWAPNAERVSVVGDFNMWDGRRNPMIQIREAGIHELFIPGLKAGACYKYEIKTKQGLPMLKADPYANAAELRPNTASVITDLTGFAWTDEKWLEKRKATDYRKEPLLIYEVHLGSWRKPDPDAEDAREFYTYRELAPMLASYVKEMGYTHVEIMPIMEHPLDESWGYQVTGYYAPTARYGTPEDFMYFMNYMHEQGIGVILDWVPAHFPKDAFGLAGFDGTCLYEHFDPRQGEHPHWGTLLYNYGRPEVKNFLIANALFWTEKYHADGIRMDAVASMLYLDYGKNEGEWIPNQYGGKENLESIEFLKHLNSIYKKRKDGALLIAEESTAWPKVTGALEHDGLGFDFKWNMGWMNDFLGYMHYDPVFRGYHHGELTFSFIYAWSENFILSLSHDEVVHGKSPMVGKMPGDRDSELNNLRAAYGFMAMHPGKKLLFMGQEFATFDEWNEKESLDWDLLQYQDHSDMQGYVKALNSLIKAHPALYADDCRPEGFQWINNISANENMLVFLRKAEGEILLVVCNFSPLVYEKHKIGVPFEGKYKEIFNSDSEEFGGSDVRNKRVKTSKKSECDGFENSIEITVPPMGVAVFACTEEKLPVKEKKTAAKKPAAKKAEPKKSSAKKEAVKPEAKKPAAKKVVAKKAEKPAAKTASRKGRTEKA
ncbi:1,4-alpha-glucan branching protein GlgB [Laedolimicola ammoniilytica]|uniref:1,4-alpha-glucan branching enzyme GlgB n=1 Tax=Laedolimicola ammoniilytica TaxID=2981771 RepID=A0ABT2RUV1_9FIRM|nr:1,4-alpha-glucan branching protein GlgB [Laedolimicola ammoniilytica]MCU6696052.1 1,4-alpha-glucan branching protein GlgB [Laedolimicola ammoniilytica]SCH42692.1 1%2C4-alpha-glucan branching enzyme GlgB [uncultured Clostridium sp.]